MGNAKGMHNMGEIYYIQMNDIPNAIPWYLKAASYNIPESKEKLLILKKKGLLIDTTTSKC